MNFRHLIDNPMPLAEAQKMPRTYLIEILCWNDPNGCYTDTDSILEFGAIAEKRELIDCLINQGLVL